MCTALAPSQAHGAGELPTASASSSAAPAAPLPELPKLQSIALPEPEAATLQELDRVLDGLTGDDERSRTNAKGAITDATAAWVPAIHQRLQEIRGTIDRETAPRVLEDARKAGRESLKKKGDGAPAPEKKKKKKGDESAEDDGGDWLEFLLAKPKPKSDTWRDLVKIYAMERMLAHIGTTPAIREMIGTYAYFNDLVRIDVQRQVTKLRDKAVPALIEARQHDAKNVAKWANRQLDQMGKAIAGEAVSTNDAQILADVLRAFGRTRDVDAARVLLSFCNSDRVQLRDAAREAIAAIGEPGMWQLKDAYLNLTGNKPPREWTWDRVAREIFGAYDRARLAEVYKLMDDGVALAKEGKNADAVAAFDKVLARAPLFERRKEMVSAYVSAAKETPQDKREDALALLRKALRLDPASPDKNKLQAEIYYLEGAILLNEGTPDKLLFQKALELDPTHERAKIAIASLGARAEPREDHMKRYVAAGGIGLVALLAMILLYRGPSRKKAAPKPEAAPPAA